MTRRGKEFNEIYDLTAMRVLVESDKDCYGAIGVIHALWKPMPGRFKDYIAMPKTNGYQSLHTTVIGPQGKPLEIQVRTHRMHQTAEFGVAAHWLYKDGKPPSPQRWLHEVVEGADDADPQVFMDALRTGLFDEEVYVFTPKGELKALAAGRDAARLRVRRAHRRRPPLRRREGERPHRAAARTRCCRATSSRCSPRSPSAARRATG